MLPKSPKTDFKNDFVSVPYSTNTKRNNFPANNDTLTLLEGIFFNVKQINQAEHYYLIDANKDSYSRSYEKQTLSNHAVNIYFLSSVLENVHYKNLPDPLNSFYDLESLIVSAQFYKNIILGITDSYLYKLLNKLISDISKIIIFFKNNNLNRVYKNTINSDNAHKLQPQTLNKFIEHLKVTNQYLIETLNQLSI